MKKAKNGREESASKGFTLLELLIVLAVLAILAVILIIVLNPSEVLRRSRDAQRLSDLATLKTALATYVTSVESPEFSADQCFMDGAGGAQIMYSYSSDAEPASVNVDEGTDAGALEFTTQPYSYISEEENHLLQVVDGQGWVGVNLTETIGGSPLSQLPIDPINIINDPSSPTSQDRVYRYACQYEGGAGTPSNVFEFNAILESDAYTSGADNKHANDGGDNDNYYEIGTSVRLIGDGENF